MNRRPKFLVIAYILFHNAPPVGFCTCSFKEMYGTFNAIIGKGSIEQKKMNAATQAAASTQEECKKHLMRGKAREEAKSFETVQ
jgi:hypothetical protein